jgi:hypothetical protein
VLLSAGVVLRTKWRKLAILRLRSGQVSCGANVIVLFLAKTAKKKRKCLAGRTKSKKSKGKSKNTALIV